MKIFAPATLHPARLRLTIGAALCALCFAPTLHAQEQPSEANAPDITLENPDDWKDIPFSCPVDAVAEALLAIKHNVDLSQNALQHEVNVYCQAQLDRWNTFVENTAKLKQSWWGLSSKAETDDPAEVGANAQKQETAALNSDTQQPPVTTQQPSSNAQQTSVGAANSNDTIEDKAPIIGPRYAEFKFFRAAEIRDTGVWTGALINLDEIPEGWEEERFARLYGNDYPPQAYIKVAIGDTMPDGRIITAMGQGYIELTDPSTKRTWRPLLYRMGQAEFPYTDNFIVIEVE